MANEILELRFKEILAAVNDCLKPFHFKRKSIRFRYFDRGNCGVIEFQRSKHSDLSNLIFTINVAIVCDSLLEHWNSTFENCDSADGVIRERIGSLLPAKKDYWWTLSNEYLDSDIKDEVVKAIEKYAVSFVMRFIETNEIIAFWESKIPTDVTKPKIETLLFKLKEHQLKHNTD